MVPDPWISVAQVAEYIGVSQEIIYRWIKERNMPAHRVGKFWKFRLEEVDRWIFSGDVKNQGSVKSADRQIE